MGIYRAEAGEVYIKGKRTDIPDSLAAIAQVSEMVFQHFKLVENFYGGWKRHPRGAEDSALLGPSRRSRARRPEAAASDFELEVESDTLIENLSVGPPAAGRNPEAALSRSRYP